MLTVVIVLMVQELEGAMPLVNRLAGERFTELKGKFFKRLPRRLDNLEAALEVQHIQTQGKNHAITDNHTPRIQRMPKLWDESREGPESSPSKANSKRGAYPEPITGYPPP